MIFKLIWQLIGVLQKDKELANSATWKNVQGTTSIILGTVSLVAAGLDYFFGIKIADDVREPIAAGVALLGNAFVTYSTSKKVGISPSEGANQDA